MHHCQIKNQKKIWGGGTAKPIHIGEGDNPLSRPHSLGARRSRFFSFTTRTLDGWRHIGKYAPKTPQKGAWIGSLSQNDNLYIAIWSPELSIPRTSDLRTEFRPWKALRGCPPWPQTKANTTRLSADSRHLENWYDVIFPQCMVRLGRNSAAGCRIIHILRRNGRDRNRK